MRVVAIWAGLLLVCVTPIAVATTSPLLEWRTPVYIGAGLCGVVSLSLMFLQPLLAGRALPGLSAIQHRVSHRSIGIAITLLVVLHVLGLWITSPPDVIDALLFVSATPFSVWGVIAMWSVLITACLLYTSPSPRDS